MLYAELNVVYLALIFVALFFYVLALLAFNCSTYY